VKEGKDGEEEGANEGTHDNKAEDADGDEDQAQPVVPEADGPDNGGVGQKSAAWRLPSAAEVHEERERLRNENPDLTDAEAQAQAQARVSR
jgi:hypothetical protein